MGRMVEGAQREGDVWSLRWLRAGALGWQVASSGDQLPRCWLPFRDRQQGGLSMRREAEQVEKNSRVHQVKLHLKRL